MSMFYIFGPVAILVGLAYLAAGFLIKNRREDSDED